MTASPFRLMFQVPGIPQEIVMPTHSKSQAQAMINVLDMSRVTNVYVAFIENGVSRVAYVPHETTHQLVAPK